ncbi:putative E3 ubiquitin-protein ligase [Tetrabaena socialis]|uniref:RBR-type E3 ubiquitin transferase n=1 Tax=Tetrabaena socialis TaxID=47790 RepID=A0A2J8AFJ4_9CHLO|nr:putative E3 ubiquitin-protein ligase [Tetrabaena socialis]|eukprot:PNH11262.1 putative E3 ubiquitin-protein ligase [Tetrabaena socialis]
MSNKSVAMRDADSDSSASYYGSDSDASSDGASFGMGDHHADDAGPSTSRGAAGYEILDTGGMGFRTGAPEAILRLQAEVVAEVVSILGVKPSVAKTVLMYFRWDKEALLTKVAEHDPDSVLKHAGIAVGDGVGPAAPARPRRVVQVDGDPFVEPECSCGKVFCFKCLKDPHTPCTCKMWDQWDEKIHGDSETRNWFMANTKPCPKCSKPVQKEGGCNLVMCKCGQAFCWLCGAATGTAHTWQKIEGHSCGRWKVGRSRVG